MKTNWYKPDFRLIFLNGFDLAGNYLLDDMANGVGMHSYRTVKNLTTIIYLHKINEHKAASRKMGITGVHIFFIASKHIIQQALVVDFWSYAIKDIN